MAWTLKDNGFTNVKALVGGFDAWEKAGYPTEPKDGPKDKPKSEPMGRKGKRGQGERPREN